MLIPSKLSRPVRLDHTVVRERLLAKLSGANNFRLALVTSPAGYGKTTLVSQWAAGKNELGWYSLDEGDNQQERFASYLIAAIQQAAGIKSLVHAAGHHHLRQFMARGEGKGRCALLIAGVGQRHVP